MENKKDSKVIIIVLSAIIVLILLAVGINFFLLKKRINSYKTGHFEIRDGVETYVESGQVIINTLVEVDDKLYYVDDKGHKIKDSWAKIDNDGNYGYFGSLGDLVKDRVREIDGKLYYFDKDGILYTDKTSKEIIKIEGVEYIANAKGELRHPNEKETVASIVKQTQAAQIAQTQAAQIAQTQVAQTTISQNAQPQINSTTAAVIVSTDPPFANTNNTTNQTVATNVANNTPAVSQVEGPGAGIVTPGSSTVKVETTGEVKIVSTEKVIDTIEGEDYECTVTLLRPIMAGATTEETEVLNICIDELMDTWFDLVNKEVDGSVTFPKSVTFTSASLGTVKKSTITINLTGNIKPKSGSSKTIKFRITYNREDQTADIVKSSN